MSTTFSADSVTPAVERASEMPVSRYLATAAGYRRILAFDGVDGQVLAVSGHPFAKAAYHAFCGHQPLVLSPDAVWMTIAQGFAQHAALDPEAMRGRLVDHQGRRTIRQAVPDLDSTQDWATAIGALAASVRAEVPELGAWLANDFTTSTPATRIAGDIVLLDSVQHYFDYQMQCICGIPEVTLLGSVADWEKIEERVARLDSFGLGWWSRLLQPVCRELTRSAAGEPDAAFWESICMPQEVYGGRDITGWLMRFFPYVLGPDFDDDYSANSESMAPVREAYTRNHRLGPWSIESRLLPSSGRPSPMPTEAHRPWLCAGLSLEALPPGFSGAPVKVLDPDGQPLCDVQILSGFVGIAQHDNLALEARVGWAVVEGKKPLERKR